MTDRYELIEHTYDGKRIVHISNVSWVLADALMDILREKCAGRLVVEEMSGESDE